ncbi:hypothetical protein FACS189411_00220 [Bacteroidia bacterium]|jgi:hypothetical protein|nr:hypothetical protein [Tannerella sp.]GHU54122.1 hypothetical protein FACS189411_00220 [Bacteroidia bacterium]
MKKKKTEAIEGFRAVEFMRETRSRINRETQGMGFEELKKYFDNRRAKVQIQP